MVSIYPCDVCRKRASTRLASAYITVARGGDRRTRKLRVCPDCLDDIHSTHGERWQLVDDAFDVPLEAMCASCAETLEASAFRHSLFVTEYPRSDIRRDYYAELCSACADGLADALDLVDDLKHGAP